MNTAYGYKSVANNASFNNVNSNKGTYNTIAKVDSAEVMFAEKCMTSIDNIIDFICSARVLIVAKALFAFIALLGFFGVIGGIEFGTISLVSGVALLSAIIGVEFFILRD